LHAFLLKVIYFGMLVRYAYTLVYTGDAASGISWGCCKLIFSLPFSLECEGCTSEIQAFFDLK